VTAYSGAYRVVAVPSRLYYFPTDRKSLPRFSGLRFMIKDDSDFHLAGMATVKGDRPPFGAHMEMFDTVKAMIAHGAVIIGTIKKDVGIETLCLPQK